jgi:hypothetical protein
MGVGNYFPVSFQQHYFDFKLSKQISECAHPNLGELFILNRDRSFNKKIICVKYLRKGGKFEVFPR